MDALTYFILALNARLYVKKHWLLSVLAITVEDADEWKKNPYPYRLVRTPTTVFYVNPENPDELLEVKGMNGPANPVVHYKTPIKLPAGTVENLSTEVTTTIGNLLFNKAVLVHSFGSKIPFMTGRINIRDVEKVIEKLLVDNPEDGQEEPVDKITVREYLLFTKATFNLTGLTQVCVPGVSKKAILPPPGITEFKAKVIEENKDRLSDPATAAIINKATIAFDTEYLKGDSSEGFLIDSKSRSTVRRNLFLNVGAEASLDDKQHVDFIANSLHDGWDIKNMPAMNNAQRAGSFYRGAQTAMGGEEVKWLMRASSNMVITKGDCGTALGIPVTMDETDIPTYLGFSFINNLGKSEVMTEENAKLLLGKSVMMRSTMFCKAGSPDYCECCSGPKLSGSPMALSASVSNYGSMMLLIFMGAAHGTTLTTVKMNYKNSFV